MKNLRSNQSNQKLKALRLGITMGLATLFLTVLLYGIRGMNSVYANPGILYVDGTTGQNTSTCGTTGSPCKTISYTLNSRASGGDTIRVAQGVYTENLAVDKQVTLEGGYVPSGTLWLTRTGETVIDGSSSRTAWGDWDGRQVVKPAVISDSTEYKMWFDGRNLLDEAQVGLATSSDGISWTKYPANPVLTGTASAWDESGEHGPFVLKEGGVYKMWYEGDNGDVRQLGYATSTNGIDWNKYTGNPVLEAGPESFDQDTAGHGSVLTDSGTYKLWYHAGGDQGAIIAYATSPDGINWTKQGPVLRPASAGSWDDGVLWGPSVLKLNSTYWMWYAAGGSQEFTAIGVVTSTNGITWTRFLVASVITETGWVGDPHVISDSGKLKMWYNIWHEDGTGDIAYAESDDGISWTKSPINPVLSPGTPGQWGQPAVAFVEGSDGSVLDGFTVRNGEALRGGGILVEGTGGTIRNCTVVNNTAYETGGGVMINSGARAVIQSNQILSNTVPESPGSGVCIDSSEVLLDSNLIAYNACTDYVHGNGAIGIDMDGPSLPVTVTNNVVVFNTDKGIMVNDGVHDLQIINNTIASNRNEGILAGGTITVSLLRNNIIALNGYDCGIAAAQGAEFQTLDHNDVWQDDYCDYGGAVNPPTPGIGSISEDPLFVDVANGDFHLQADSPCIDAGTSVGAPATDIEGTLRDAIPDIGAYEWGKYRIFLPLTLRNVGS